MNDRFVCDKLLSSMNGKALDEVDQFKYLGSTLTKDGTSIKEVKIRLAQAYSATKDWQCYRKLKWSIFPQRLNSTNHLPCQYCSMDVRTGRWWRTWWGESKPLKRDTHEDARRAIRRAQKKKRMCMAAKVFTVWSTQLVGRQALLVSTAKHRKLS